MRQTATRRSWHLSRRGNLWLYNGEEDELTEVFSFSDQEGRDMRSKNDQHAVRIISMDDDGNLAFAVYGYMNRGYHEGEVGVGIYYFSVDTNAIEEKAFYTEYQVLCHRSR